MPEPTPSRTVVLAGASGLIGSAVAAALRANGDTVVRLVRRPAAAADERTWDPSEGVLDPKVLDGVDGVVNVGGAGVGDHRWTDAYREEILRSRLDGTSLLARTAAACERPPCRVLQASASGFYGSRGEEVLDESSAAGTGFLADVVQAWEAAADPARAAGVPVVHLRSGIVMTSRGGAVARMLPLFRWGLGGRLGSGRQWWPWITLEDEVGAILHLLRSTVTGPVNLTAPEPARNADVTAALGRALHRPTVLPVPAVALRAVLGGFSGDILGSQRILPTRLVADGFSHRHPTIERAAAWLVA